MNTHNIHACFYGEITKIVPKLSSKPSLSVPLEFAEKEKKKKQVLIQTAYIVSYICNKRYILYS